MRPSRRLLRHGRISVSKKEATPPRRKQTIHKQYKQAGDVAISSLFNFALAEAAPPTEVWHSHYDDPNGDLVLVSSDGIKFRTYSGLIAKTTSFFKPMNGVILPPSDSADRKPHVVKLDYESTIIVHFLDCASVSAPILSTGFDDSVNLLGLADQLQAEKLVNPSQALNLMDTSTLISETGEPDATMIRLDYPARIVTLFLDTAPMSAFKFTTTSFDDAVSLLALAEKFEAQKLIARVIQYLPTATGERVADLLLLASARDDWAMGRTALAQFHGYRVKLIASRPGGFEGFFAELRPTWRQTLKDLVFFHSLEKKKLLYDWYDIRAKFIEPPPPPPSHPSPAPASPVVAADKRKSNEDPDAAQKRIKTEQAEEE